MTYDSKIKEIVLLECARQSIDPATILAMIHVESGGNTFVTRFEPEFSYTKEVDVWSRTLGVTALTESVGQKTSWGLMQVMGATARTLGFHGYFPQLCDPEVGVHFGCLYFKKQLVRWENEEIALASYNAGGPKYAAGKLINQNYVDKVLKRKQVL